MSQTVGRYEIERELGEGGMATVYLARDTVMDRKVVVKVILRDYARDPQFRARFLREAKTIAALEHDSIVSVHDFGEHDGQPYIVMRQMSGGSLQDRAPYSQLTLPEIARIIERIADALDYVHSKGVIHRDLKPANILFDERGKAYLSDFGIAKLSEASTQLTGTGIIGTPAYMSPEQAQAMQDLDKRSDVYSLGVIVFQLLTGELPYHARDAMGMALAHISQPVPEIRKTRPDLPRESDALIKRAMAKKPGDRYQTTTDLANDLSKLANKPATKPRGNLFQPPADKPKTPTPATLKPALPADDPPPTSSPESSSFSPKASQPAVWALLTALVAVCILAALLAGIWAVPNLFTRNTATAQPTDVAAVIVTTPTLTHTKSTNTTTPTVQPSSTFTTRPSETLTI
jgi:serine/threonine-protein kinase